FCRASASAGRVSRPPGHGRGFRRKGRPRRHVDARQDQLHRARWQDHLSRHSFAHDRHALPLADCRREGPARRTGNLSHLPGPRRATRDHGLAAPKVRRRRRAVPSRERPHRPRQADHSQLRGALSCRSSLFAIRSVALSSRPRTSVRAEGSAVWHLARADFRAPKPAVTVYQTVITNYYPPLFPFRDDITSSLVPPPPPPVTLN